MNPLMNLQHAEDLAWAAAEYEAYVADREWATEGSGATMQEFGESLASISDYAHAAREAARVLSWE